MQKELTLATWFTPTIPCSGVRRALKEKNQLLCGVRFKAALQSRREVVTGAHKDLGGRHFEAEKMR